MRPFREHRGRVAPLDRINVDTDQIIPKQFLKRIERTGFGQFLFYDWRFSADGKKNAGICFGRAAVSRREHSGGGEEFWLRLLPRARCVGAGGFRIPRRYFIVVR